MASRSILLKGGIVLTHDAANHVEPKELNILIQDGKITKLEKHIETPDGVEIIDCVDKIISPGFIDTHHHGWQTQLKGRFANGLLLEYMITGQAQHKQYTPRDIFYGQLAGMLEAIAAGTTTVVDHAHMTVTADHAKLAVAATASSEWVMRTFAELADSSPFGDGRVTIGFAWDLWFLPSDLVKNVFNKVREKNIKLITTHGTEYLNGLRAAHNHGILDSRLLISHGGNFSQDDVKLIRKAGVHVSATPSTELQMAMERPVCFDAAFSDPNIARHGVQDCASLGVDCHSNNAGSIVMEARLGLQNARNHFHEYHSQQGKRARKLPKSLSVEAAFNLATIKGAEAAKLSHEIGKIAEGYKADLVIFDALSPSMVGAAQHDPVAAIILHSSPADIEMVIVDGTVRKKDGKLVDVTVDAGAKGIVELSNISWRDIAKEVLMSREKIQKETEKVNVAAGVDAIVKAWQIDESSFAD